MMIDSYLNRILCADCLTTMKEMPGNSIDLVVTSPPYNLKNSTGNGMKPCTTSGKWANAAKPDFKLVPKSNGVGDVWEFTQEMKNGHPAPFPVALIDRIIGSTNAQNAQIVLDPFMGSGTTAIVAMGLKRNYIGIELSPDYCRMEA